MSTGTRRGQRPHQRDGWRRLRRRLGAAVAVLGLVGAGAAASVMTSAPGFTETNAASTRGASNPFFVYLNGGEFLRAAASANFNGVLDEDGVPATPDSGTGLYGPATAAGVWQVDIGAATAANGAIATTTSTWDVTAISDTGVDIPGRVWSNLYGMSQGSTAANSTPADLDFFAVNDAGFIYEVSVIPYNGMNTSMIRADTVGNETSPGDCLPSYQSIAGFVTDLLLSVPKCGGSFRVFFAPPAADLPAKANMAGVMVDVLPPPLTAAEVTVDNLTFTPTVSGLPEGRFAWSLNPRFTGSYYLDIDTDGDGSFDGPNDRHILENADGTGQYGAVFDGLDAAGKPVEQCQVMTAQVRVPHIGEIHVNQADVEWRPNGIQILRLNGPGAPDATIYWDDTALPAGTVSDTAVLDGTAGVVSTGGVHGWGTASKSDTGTWGDNRSIDDWAWVPLDPPASGQITFGADCPAISLVKTADSHVSDPAAVGDTIDYTFVATNTGNTILTDVSVDDPMLAAASPAVPLVFVSSTHAGWTSGLSGILAPGETATFTATYPITQADIDIGHRENTATATGTPPGDDPASVTSSDDADAALPRGPALSVDKSATPSSISDAAPGDVVTYSVVVRNTGNVTLGDIAVEDAMLASASPAITLAFASSTDAGWMSGNTGSLAPGESVTYTATYPITQADIDAGHVRNTVFATGLPPVPWDASPELEPARVAGLDPDCTVSEQDDCVGSSTETVLTALAQEHHALGSVTWSKVDASDHATLLAGSQWTLTGPDGSSATVTDNGAGDSDPVFGRLAVKGLVLGDYSLAEKAAPTGYVLDTTAHSATLTAAEADVDLGAITNARQAAAGPKADTGGSLAATGARNLPALVVGAAVLLLAGAGLAAFGWRARRKA